MRIEIATPSGVAVDVDDVVHVRAEDRTGAFGIQPRHADFVTKLAISVVTFRDARGNEHHVAVRGGVLRVRAGKFVDIATREAVVGRQLAELKDAVLHRLREAAESEATARTEAARLNAAVARHLYRYVRAEATGQPPTLRSTRRGEEA
ncbi:MAG TPA: hypothetical protein VHC69_03840 [Polyangiaceae bacterium]|nr:hypothetical protein [Polyangiaceae bacterium]